MTVDDGSNGWPFTLDTYAVAPAAVEPLRDISVVSDVTVIVPPLAKPDPSVAAR